MDSQVKKLFQTVCRGSLRYLSVFLMGNFRLEIFHEDKWKYSLLRDPVPVD